MLTAHFYPSPADEITGISETVEITDADGNVVLDDFESRNHPEVPLSDQHRDTVLSRLGYRRIGPWITTPDERADATVEQQPPGPRV